MRAVLFKLIHGLVSRFPRFVVLMSLVMAAVAGFYGTEKMEMITDQDRLLSEDLEYHHRYMQFLRRFGDLEFLYILIEGPDHDSMIAYANDLAERLQNSQDIQEVIYYFDTSWAVDYALYFDDVSTSDLQKLKDELEAYTSEIEDLFSIRSIDSILQDICDELDQAQTDPKQLSENDEREINPLIAALEGKSDERLAEFSRLEKELDRARNSEREYNWTSGGKSLLMLVLPTKDYSTLSVIEAPLKRIRTDIWLTAQDHPGIKAGVTGRPALQADEMRTTNNDMMMASIVALIFVTFLFVVFFRELTRPLFGVVALLCAMGWTYGFVALTLGHLNLLSLVFALVLIGLGIDFGIHFLHRYQEELNKTGDPSQAVLGALNHAGSGIITGAVTSSVAFLLALSTDFLGLAELGYVAGMGILFCLLAMLVSLSAMFVSYDRHVKKNTHPPTPVHLLGLRHVSRFPLITVLIFIAATIALIPKAMEVRFNDNLLDLQAEGLESVEYEHKLINESEHSTWYCAFLESNPDAVRETVEKLNANPTVAKTESLADALPKADPEKNKLIRQLRASLGPFHTKRPEAYLPNYSICKKLIDKVTEFSHQLDRLDKFKTQIEKLKKAAAQLKEIPLSAEQIGQLKDLKGDISGIPEGIDLNKILADPSLLKNLSITPEQIEQFKSQYQSQQGGIPSLPAGFDLSNLPIDLSQLDNLTPDQMAMMELHPEGRALLHAKRMSESTKVESPKTGEMYLTEEQMERIKSGPMLKLPENSDNEETEIDPSRLEALGLTPDEIEELRASDRTMKTPDRSNPRQGIDSDRLKKLNLTPEQIALLQKRNEAIESTPGYDISSLLKEMKLTPEQLKKFQNGELDISDIPEIGDEQKKAFNELEEKLIPLLSGDRETVIARLVKANELLLERPRTALRKLSEIVFTQPPTLDSLPPTLRKLFIGTDGSLLVMAYPKKNIWETENMREFVGEMRKIDPEVTGTPIQVYESSMLMRDSFYRIGIFSVLAVGVLVFFDFLSFRALFFVMTPLLLGVLWLIEIMGLFGVSLNLANFFAIPILIGIGVDNAVHFFHRYQENFDVEQSMYTTGTTLTLTTLTTIVGFGSLIFASHKGLASLGALMAIGSATCWFACVVFLPASIKLLSRRQLQTKEI